MGRRRTVVIKVMLAVALLVGCCGAAWVGNYRSLYGVWPLASKATDRVQWCGRRFNIDPEEPATRSEVDEKLKVNHLHLRRAGTYPPLAPHRPLWIAAVPAGVVLDKTIPCTMGVWLEDSDEKLQSYTISGGP